MRLLCNRYCSSCTVVAKLKVARSVGDLDRAVITANMQLANWQELFRLPRNHPVYSALNNIDRALGQYERRNRNWTMSGMGRRRLS